MPGLIGVPAEIHSWTGFWKSLLGLHQPKGTQIAVVEGLRTDIARNRIVKDALGYEWLFFMDSDMVFPRKALTRLLPYLSRKDVDIIGGTYFLRFTPHDPVAYKYEGMKGGTHHYSSLVNSWREFAYQHKSEVLSDKAFTIDDSAAVVEVDAIGTGCMLIKRKVLAALGGEPFSYSEGGSEDLFFCRRAKAAGFRIWWDRGLVCLHVNRVGIGASNFLYATGDIGNGRHEALERNEGLA